jgi:HPt (histidine-containing phosphotransfer) domain-containing protein
MSDDSEEPRLDLSVIDQIRRLGSVKPGLLPRLVEMFRESTGTFLESSTGGEGTPQNEQIRVGLHTLKGTAASLGATRLSGLAHELERALSSGLTQGNLISELQIIRAEFEETMREMDVIVREPD